MLLALGDELVELRNDDLRTVGTRRAGGRRERLQHCEGVSQVRHVGTHRLQGQSQRGAGRSGIGGMDDGATDVAAADRDQALCLQDAESLAHRRVARRGRCRPRATSMPPRSAAPSRLAASAFMRTLLCPCRHRCRRVAQYGHKPGYEWRCIKAKALSQGWTVQALIDYFNDPDIYQMEDPVSNQSHQFEADVCAI